MNFRHGSPVVNAWTYLQLPLLQWGTGNVYLLVLSSWKVNIDNFLDHIFKNSHQDLYNEGSKIILSPLEVGHWVAQTWAFFDKLPKITSFGPLQESENKTWF